MLKFNKIAILLIISLFFSVFQFNTSSAIASSVSKSECVIEVSSNRVLYEENSNLKLPMASTTKILTAITVIDNFDVNKKVTVPKSATNIEGSSIYLKEGETITVLELLYGLMLRSGNDCAECLAQTLTSRDNFIELMNKTANKIGATNSNFINPHGLHDNEHYTTAYDLALISSYAMKNELFKKIVSTKKINISNGTENYDRVLINKNKMLSNYSGATGIKTGYTKKAGRCLVSSANKNGMEVITVVLNCPNMWERSEQLLNYSYDTYKMLNVIDKEELSSKIYYTSENKPFIINAYLDFKYPLKSNEIFNLEHKINGKDFNLFIKNPEKYGVYEIFLQNKLIFSQNIFIVL